MMRTALGVALAATLLAGCGQNTDTDNTKGPAVAAVEAPRNEAVDTTPTPGDPGPTPGANSFTEGQARSAIERAGYTAVGTLTQGADGVWTGRATKDGKEATVSVDYKGAVTAS
jgi:hypothetical protein